MSDVRLVGIIGAGTIGREVGERIAGGAVPPFELLAFIDVIRPDNLPGSQLDTLDELLAAGPAVVVEAASHDALRAHGEAVLAHGADLICLSVGALADDAFRERLLDAARRSGARLIVPSGAVGGLDLLRAASESGLERVEIEQRKPPKALMSPEEAAALDEPRVVFEGTVRDVVSLYPLTTNVAAAVALSGLGFDETKARVVADPALQANQVVLTATGEFGEVTLRLANVASANPRTSAIAAPSIIAALRRLGEALVIPG